MNTTCPVNVIDAWMPSEIEAISPLVDQLMRLIERSRCVEGSEFGVELALREALNNAVIHGNGMDAHKLVEVHCRCERGKGVLLTVKDQGKEFDPNAVRDALDSEGLNADHGRGLYLLKRMMDEVSFESGGTEVRMRKRPTRDARTESQTNNASADGAQRNWLHGRKGKSMLKISIVEGTKQRRLVVEGKLVRPWSDELKAACAMAESGLDGRELVIDLQNLTTISRQGEELLLELMKQGAKFRGCGVFTKEILKQVARRLRGNGAQE